MLRDLRRFVLRATGHEATIARLNSIEAKLDALGGSTDSLRREVRNLPRAFSGGASPRVATPDATLDAEAQARAASGAAARKGAREAGAGPVIDRVAFLVQSAELINHYSCVWDLLPAGSTDVLLHGELEGQRVPGLENCPHQTVGTSGLLASGTRYRGLVSNHPVSLGETPLLHRLGVRNVRFMYAAGKSGWNLSAWNSLYDLILCFGPHHAEAFAVACDAVVVQMGYPRFDRYFNTVPDRDALCARFGCDAGRRTVVWLPTWKTLSSVGLFDAEVSALTQRYNVVVKLHPLMSEQEPERVAALSRHPFTCLITDSSDNLPLYQLADWMLFDYGGPPLAGVYTDKQMLLLEVPGAENDELTGTDSPDVVIRRSLDTVAPDRGAIAPLLEDAAVWTRQGERRRMLRSRYFAPYLGFSSQVAAQTLLHLDRILAPA